MCLVASKTVQEKSDRMAQEIGIWMDILPPLVFAGFLSTLVSFEGVAFVVTIWRLIEHLDSVYLVLTGQHCKESCFENVKKGILVLDQKSQNLECPRKSLLILSA